MGLSYAREEKPISPLSFHCIELLVIAITHQLARIRATLGYMTFKILTIS